MVRVPKVVKKVFITFFSLIALALLGGAAYILYTDGNSNANHSKATAKDSATISEPDIAPAQPSPNAPENAAVESLTTPVAQGSNANLIVQTNAGSTCSISVLYKGVASKDSGLITKPADKYGLVSWSWTADSATPIGNWPVNVTCYFHGRSGFVQGTLQVVPPGSAIP